MDTSLDSLLRVRPLNLLVALAAVLAALFVGVGPALDVFSRQSAPGPAVAAGLALLFCAAAVLVQGYPRADTPRSWLHRVSLIAAGLGSIAVFAARLVVPEPRSPPPRALHRVALAVKGRPGSGGRVEVLPGDLHLVGQCLGVVAGKVVIRSEEAGSATPIGDSDIKDGKWELVVALDPPSAGHASTRLLTADSTETCEGVPRTLEVTVRNPRVTLYEPALPDAQLRVGGDAEGAPSGARVVLYGVNENEINWRKICSGAIDAGRWTCSGPVRPRCQRRRNFRGRALVVLGPPAGTIEEAAFPAYASNEISVDIPSSEVRIVRIDGRAIGARPKVAPNKSAQISGTASSFVDDDTINVEVSGLSETGRWPVSVPAQADWLASVRVGDGRGFDVRAYVCGMADRKGDVAVVHAGALPMALASSGGGR